MPYSEYGRIILRERKHSRAIRRNQRRTRDLALRALKRNRGDREAAMAELRERGRDRRIELSLRMRLWDAETLLRAGITVNDDPTRRRRPSIHSRLTNDRAR